MLCAAEPAARRCKMEESSRRVVYQHDEMRRKARAKYMRQFKKLSADEKNSKENGDDPQPLPARNVFLEKNGR